MDSIEVSLVCDIERRELEMRLTNDGIKRAKAKVGGLAYQKSD